MKCAVKMLELALRAAARLPLGVLYAFSDVGYVVLRHVVRYRRAVVRANIKASFPEKSEKERRSIERCFYRHFADNAVESVKMLHMSDEEMSRRMRFENVELIDRLFEENRDIVAYFSHCGNWEWATSVGMHTRTGRDGAADFGFVYRPLKNKVMDALMLEIRGRFGASAFPKATVLRELIRRRRDGRRFIVGFMSDQKPSHGDPAHILMFLNHPTAMISGTETLARKLDTAVIYWDMKRLRRGHYSIECKLMTRSAAAETQGSLTDSYASLLQATIEREPSIWLWSHKRWKKPVTMPCQ